MNREEAIEVYNGLINIKIKEAFEFFAPELRKINEEEIRKDLIGGLMWQRDNLKSEGPHDNNLILPGFCLTVGKHLAYLEKQKDLDKMIVVSPEVWDNAISDAFENGKKEGEHPEKQKPSAPNKYDEKMRKKIIDHLESIKMGCVICTIDTSEEIAWLEKQKEQPISAEEVLARAGLKPYKDGNQWCILVGDNIQEGICGFGDTIEDALYEFLKEVLDFQNKQNSLYASGIAEPDYGICDDYIPAALHCAMARHGWYACHVGEKEGFILQRKKYVERNWPADKDNLTQEQKPAEWSEKHIADVFEKVGLAKIVREQANDALTNAVQSAMIELSKVGNAEWSEEDADILNCCISSIEEAKENRYAYKETDGDTSYDHEIAWLKSLRPSWKPSEEQMKAFKNSVEHIPNAYYDDMWELYEQLKKL